jgi:hypothetical protein
MKKEPEPATKAALRIVEMKTHENTHGQTAF